MPGPMTRVVGVVATHARAVRLVYRDRQAVTQAIRLGCQLMIEGGITVATPDEDNPLIMTIVQLDGDILVGVSPELVRTQSPQREAIAAQHAGAVRARLAPLAHLPDALRAGSAFVLAALTALDAGVVLSTGGIYAIFYAAARSASYFFLPPVIRRASSTLLHRVIRTELDRSAAAMRAASHEAHDHWQRRRRETPGTP